LDKLLKDNYKYVQCCLLCLAEGIQVIIPTILKTVSEQLVAEIEGKAIEDKSNLEFIKSGKTDYGDFSDIKTSQLFHSSILLELQINALIRSRVFSSPMI
jgi:hypothetical protein